MFLLKLLPEFWEVSGLSFQKVFFLYEEKYSFSMRIVLACWPNLFPVIFIQTTWSLRPVFEHSFTAFSWDGTEFYKIRNQEIKTGLFDSDPAPAEVLCSLFIVSVGVDSGPFDLISLRSDFRVTESPGKSKEQQTWSYPLKTATFFVTPKLPNMWAMGPEPVSKFHACCHSWLHI